MKRKLPLILLILCLCVIGLGIYGIVRSNRAQESVQAEADVTGVSIPASGAQAAETKPEVAPVVSRIDVKTPASLKEQLKDYEGFLVSFNADNHTPNWVAWELLATEADGPEKRKDFWTDEEIEGCPVNDDYRGSGYDRGHLCPAADQKWSSKAMEDCFVFANMVPQDHALNAGAWQTLESKERQWAVRDSAIWIVAGPIYNDGDKQRIGPSGVRVPGAFFKVIAAPFLDEPRGIAFIYPNMTSPGNMENYVMTIRDVEKVTGYDFFHTLPDDLEDAIETVSSFKDWNKRR